MGKRRANGEGSIRKRDDGSWEARILINGKSRSIYGRTQSDVRKKLTEVRNDLDNDEYLEPNDTTLKEWLELWQDEYLEDVKQSTADRYKSCMQSASSIGSMNETPQSAVPTAPLIGEPISMPPLSGEVPPQGAEGFSFFLGFQVD